MRVAPPPSPLSVLIPMTSSNSEQRLLPAFCANPNDATAIGALNEDVLREVGMFLTVHAAIGGLAASCRSLSTFVDPIFERQLVARDFHQISRDTPIAVARIAWYRLTVAPSTRPQIFLPSTVLLPEPDSLDYDLRLGLRRGWGCISYCRLCACPCAISLHHNCCYPNLLISQKNAVAWYGDTPCSFEIVVAGERWTDDDLQEGFYLCADCAPPT